MSSFAVDWMYTVLFSSIILNIVFVVGAIIYTLVRRPDEEPRVSVGPSLRSWEDGRRHSSLSPQVMLYHNLVRLSISNAESTNRTFWQRFGCSSKNKPQASMEQKQ